MGQLSYSEERAEMISFGIHEQGRKDSKGKMGENDGLYYKARHRWQKLSNSSNSGDHDRPEEIENSNVERKIN